MKTSLKLLAFLFAFSAGISSLAAATPNLSKPTAKYWHLWVDSDGKSHMTQCAMGDFVLQSMNKPADPQWQDRQSGNGRVIFTIQPAQWKGTWHEDPKVCHSMEHGSLKRKTEHALKWDRALRFLAKTYKPSQMRRDARATCPVILVTDQ
jgi:hypothetical protein